MTRPMYPAWSWLASHHHFITPAFSLWHLYTDAELDILVANYKLNCNESGSRYVRGFLKANKLRIQKARVFASMRRLDALGNALRENRSIRRRKYATKRPNSLWHCDGHHKLIRWGIVIHGFIDGFCRTVSFQIIANGKVNHI